LFGTAIAAVNPHSWTVRGDIVAAVLLAQVHWADAVQAALFSTLGTCEWADEIMFIISSHQL
jgi:hypothetical protein